MPRSNTYEAGTASIAELFGDYLVRPLENGTCIALTLSTAPLGPAACNAIEKSLDALGYGADGCAYATIRPSCLDGPESPAANGAQASAAPDANAPQLDPQALFMLVEGLDPLFVIAADDASRKGLGEAYRTDYPADAPIRVFGRSSIAFSDLGSLLETDGGKRKAWQVFKSIPKRQ